MKKIFAIIVSALLVTSLAACGNDTTMAGVDDNSAVSSNVSVADNASEDDDNTVSVADESEDESKSESEDESKDESKTESKTESKVAKDLSNMTNPYVVGAVVMELPEGFSMSDEEAFGAQIAIPDDYPEHTDNITFYDIDEEEDMKLYSKESIKEQYSKALDGFTDVDVYEQYDVDGIPVIRTSYTVVVDDVSMTQTQVIVFYEGGTCAITYTSVSGDFDEAFEESIASITAAYE